MKDMEQQPPVKKMATDGPICAELNSSPSRMQGETTAPVSSGDANAGPSSSPAEVPDKIVSDRKNRRNEVNGRHLKASAMLAQVWNDDLNSGHLLVKLFELFGENILSFIPAPELSLFL